MLLQPNESELIGRWDLIQGKVIGDATTQRIKWLVENALVELGADSTGWDVLYRDPRDGRMWELTYPESDSHGSGPPRLTVLDLKRAEDKYGHVASAD